MSTDLQKLARHENWTLFQLKNLACFLSHIDYRLLQEVGIRLNKRDSDRLTRAREVLDKATEQIKLKQHKRKLSRKRKTSLRKLQKEVYGVAPKQA